MTLSLVKSSAIVKPISAFRPKLVYSIPHPISQIRQVDIVQGDKYDHEYVKKRQEILHYHHQFWKENNLAFEAAREEYLNRTEDKELDEFYRSFAMKNLPKMMEYNQRLWKESLLLIGPGLKYESQIVRKWIRHVSSKAKEHMRLYFFVWFTAGLAFPLCFQ